LGALLLAAAPALATLHVDDLNDKRPALAPVPATPRGA
jgi:hypothetical protein